MVSVIAVMTTAYVCHYCVHPLYCELADATPKKFNGVASIAMTLCTTIYCGVSISALALFGDDTHADVLVNFQRNTALYQLVIKGGYVMSLALTYPLLFCVMREVLVELAVVKEVGAVQVAFSWNTVGCTR